MQLKFFTIPILGGEAMANELNVFLRSQKVLECEKHFSVVGQQAFWVVCVSYLAQSDSPTFTANYEKAAKIDYRQVLDEASFQRFAKLRDIRKAVSTEEAVPAYAIFTDEELAGLAKIEPLTAAKMLTVKGIGEKKVARYAPFFLKNNENDGQTHEKS